MGVSACLCMCEGWESHWGEDYSVQILPSHFFCDLYGSFLDHTILLAVLIDLTSPTSTRQWNLLCGTLHGNAKGQW